jgi:hypothetical protein
MMIFSIINKKMIKEINDGITVPTIVFKLICDFEAKVLNNVVPATDGRNCKGLLIINASE